MRKISLFILLSSLAGCTAPGPGSMNAPGSTATTVSYPAVTSRKSGVDVEAINAAIRAGQSRYWAPEDEVYQQSVGEAM